MTTINPLTREQKLLAEIIVQLGNVSEAIRQASQGENSGELASQVGSLQSELTALTADNAALAQQLADSNLMVSQLQQQLQLILLMTSPLTMSMKLFNILESRSAQ